MPPFIGLRWWLCAPSAAWAFMDGEGRLGLPRLGQSTRAGTERCLLLLLTSLVPSQFHSATSIPTPLRLSAMRIADLVQKVPEPNKI